MRKKIKIKGGKRTVFVQNEKYFLELPEFDLNINYTEYYKYTYEQSYVFSFLDFINGGEYKATSKYEVSVKLSRSFILANIRDKNICLGKSYFPKKDFPNNIVSRFFCSRFQKFFTTKESNQYFYSQWQKYGFKYHELMFKAVFRKRNLTVDQLKEIESKLNLKKLCKQK
jgi:hypothetical protein